MSIANKLSRILNIKNQIKTELQKKGVLIDNNTPFSDYPYKIAAINSIIDTTPPVTTFILIKDDKGDVSITGQTEPFCKVSLRNPFGVNIPVNVDLDGKITGIMYSVDKPVEGEYTLISTDPYGNATTVKYSFWLVLDYALNLFVDPNVKGIYYDFNDLNTQYIDVSETTHASSVGQTIAKIKDKSKRGWDSIQSTVSSQYKIYRNSTSGTYCAQFDGIDDSLSATLIEPYIHNQTTIIMAVDVRQVSSSNLYMYLLQSLPSNWGLAIMSRSENSIRGGIQYSSNSFSGVAYLDNLGVPATQDVIVLRIDTNSIRINGNYKSSADVPTTSGTQVTTRFSIASTTKGLVYKVVIVNRIITEEEERLIRMQFNQEMGVSL